MRTAGPDSPMQACARAWLEQRLRDQPPASRLPAPDMECPFPLMAAVRVRPGTARGLFVQAGPPG